MATGSVTSGDVRLLVLRGAVGVVMVAHGYNHILGRWKDCGYQPLRHNCVCVVRRGELTWIPYFASKALVTRLPVRGYVRGVERQLALRLNRSNEATSCWSWADLSPCLMPWSPATPACGYSDRQQKSRDLGKRQSSAMATPRAARRSLQALQEDKPVATKHLRCLPYEVCGGRRITYIECQVRSGCLVDSVCERRHREGASDWCEVARSACLSRS